MFDVLLLGQKIGTASNFDIVPSDNVETQEVQYYEFVPENITLLEHRVVGCVALDYVQGIVSVYGEEGTHLIKKLKFYGDLQFSEIPLKPGDPD